MMHPFLQLEDNTEIVHSDIMLREGQEQVQFLFDKPNI